MCLLFISHLDFLLMTLSFSDMVKKYVKINVSLNNKHIFFTAIHKICLNFLFLPLLSPNPAQNNKLLLSCRSLSLQNPLTNYLKELNKYNWLLWEIRST